MKKPVTGIGLRVWGVVGLRCANPTYLVRVGRVSGAAA